MSVSRERTIPASMSGCAAALLALAAIPGFATAQQDPPEPLPLSDIPFPAFEERLLAMGADLIVVPHNEQPYVTVNLVVKAGNAADARNRVGTAAMVASLLDKGTKTRSALEIADAADHIGASLGGGAGDDWTNVTLGVVTSQLDAALELLGDIVVNPAFPQEEIDLYRQQAITSLRLQLGSPGFLANREFLQAIYGRHPYGLFPTPESVEAIRRADLIAFHLRHYKPTNALVVVAGDVTTDDIEARLNTALADWEPGPSRPPTYFDVPEREETEIILVHRPESVQSTILVGQSAMRGNHADWMPLSLGSRVLGGSSTGRLFQVLREEKGWTYGSYTSAVRKRDIGYFAANAEVRSEVTDSTLAELLNQVGIIREEPVPEPELADVRDYLIGSFPLGIETPQAIANQVATYRLRGRSTEELESYRDRVASIAPHHIRDALVEHFDPGQAVVVVVGDATQIRSGLTRFGRVRMVDVEGTPLTLDDVEVRDSDIAYDPSVLEPGIWNYRLTVQGRQFAEVQRVLGFATRNDERAMSFTTTVRLDNVTQVSQVFFSPRTFRPIANVVRLVTPQGQQTLEVEMDGERVTGRATGTGQDDREFEEEVVRGALLGDMPQLVAWMSELEEGQEIRFPIVSQQNGRVRTMTIRVRGTSEITVPAGTFEVFELSLSGGQGNQRGYFTVEQPHVLVREETTGLPYVIELVEVPGG